MLHLQRVVDLGSPLQFDIISPFLLHIPISKSKFAIIDRSAPSKFAYSFVNCAYPNDIHTI